MTDAWLSNGRAGRLWYATVTPEFHRRWGSVNTENGLWHDGGRPPGDPETDLACTVRCRGSLLGRKFAALAAHTTQTATLIGRMGRRRYRMWWADESFVDSALRRDQEAA